MSNQIKLLIIGSILAFLILSGIQYYLIENTYRYKISAFEKEVKEKAFSVADDFSRFDSLKLNGIKHARNITQGYYDHHVERKDLLDSLFLMRSMDTLNQLLVAEFQNQMGDHQQFEYGSILRDYILIDTVSRELDTIFSGESNFKNKLFGNLSTLDDAIEINTGTSSSNWGNRDRTYLYSATYFLSIRKWKSKVLQRMWSLIALSIFILLSVIALFIYTLKSWLQQKKINEVKNDFINNITHEFKTPLTTLSIASKTLRNPKVRGNEGIYVNTLNSIDRQNIRLQKLIDQVMTQSLGSKEMKLKREIFQDDIFMNEIVDDFRLSLQDKDVQINRKFKNLGSINVDRFYLTTAIVNVLENAIKYGGTVVDISFTKVNRDIRLIIKDNGIGIQKENQDEIFDKFYRVSTGDRHDVKGLGLGLYYTWSIVEAHQGIISVSSDGLDKGTKFEISLQNVYL